MNRICACLGLLIAAMAPLGSPPAFAQTVVRCGNAYGEQPCAGGTLVPAADPRSEAQRAQSAAATARDARMAQAMEDARRQAETDGPPGTPPAATVASRPAAKPPGERARAAAVRPFKAVAPAAQADKGRRKPATVKKTGAQEKKKLPAPKKVPERTKRA